MRKCEYCGTPRHKEEIKCPACGAYYPDEGDVSSEKPTDVAVIEDSVAGVAEKSDFVVNAETKLRSPAVKKITTALVFFVVTLFLGVLGIHRIVKGKVATGILWLLTCGLFGIGYIVDVVMSGCNLAKAGIDCAKHINDD